jgi:hypothetical protein
LRTTPGLADALLEESALEIRLHRATVDILSYWTNVLKRCEGMLEQYDNFDVLLPVCDGEGQRQSFIRRLSSCCQDLEAVNNRMCQLAPQEASQAVSDVAFQNGRPGNGGGGGGKSGCSDDMQVGNDNAAQPRIDTYNHVDNAKAVNALVAMSAAQQLAARPQQQLTVLLTAPAAVTYHEDGEDDDEKWPYLPDIQANPREYVEYFP